MKEVPQHKPKQVEFIEQRHKSDCGIACVAMLCGLMYDDVASLYYSFKKTTRGGIYPEDIFELLELVNCDCKEVEVLPAKGLALVAIQWKEPNTSGHYIVWDSKRGQFLDPLHGVVNKREMLKLADMEEIWKIKRG